MIPETLNRVRAALPAATLLILACSEAATPVPDCSAAAELPAWIDPTAGGPGLDAEGMPLEVDGYDDCAFNKFAWQDFLAAVRPAAAGGGAYFQGWEEKWEMLAGNIALDPPLSGLAENALVETVEAGPAALPLPDVNGQWTYYAQRLNSTAVEFLERSGLLDPDYAQAVAASELCHPRYSDSSVETKEAWKVLTAEEIDSDRFFTATATLYPGDGGTSPLAEDVTVGLVGLHLEHVTPRNGAWVWMTFEHRDNAPDCDEAHRLLAAGEGGPFNYFDPACVAKCPPQSEETAHQSCAARCAEFNVYQNGGCALDTKPVFVSPVKPGTTSTTQPFACGAGLAGTCRSSKGCFEANSDEGYYGGYRGGPNCYRADLCLSAADQARARRTAAGCSAAVPTQVCRAWPVGLRGVRTEADAYELVLDPTLAPLNDEIAAFLAGEGPEWRVWSNYRLVGVQWGENREGISAPYNTDQVYVRGDPLLINTTMEAYIQARGLELDPSGGREAERRSIAFQLDVEPAGGDLPSVRRFQGGCMGCHGTKPHQFAWAGFGGVNFTPWRQFHFSHVLDYMAPPRLVSGSRLPYCEQAGKCRDAADPGQCMKGLLPAKPKAVSCAEEPSVGRGT